METYAKMLQIGILFFVVLILIEWLASVRIKRPVYRAMDTVSSLSSGLTNTLKDVLKLSVVIVSYDYAYKHLAQFEVQNTLWIYFLAFVMIDFAAYWSHRWTHEFNVLWNRHIIHHSSEEFYLAAALRQSISGIFGIFFFLYLPMAIIGIAPQVIAVVAPIHLFAQFWYHTKLIGRMGVLEHVIVTPSHHRVHHAINAEYIDKNFAAIFIVWDKWFGTFQEEIPNIPPVYGTKKPVQTWNPFLINFMHIWQLMKDAWRTSKWQDKIRIWFMPTGWRPADVAKAYPIQVTHKAKDQVKYDTPASKALVSWAFVQLIIHVGLQFHLISLLPSLAYLDLLLYGLFMFVSIFAYTALIDRVSWAVPAEIVKCVAGWGLLYVEQGWFNLNEMVPYGSQIMAGYFLLSLGLTIYFSYLEKSSEPQLKPAHSQKAGV